jgi:cardiolipin synthase
VVLREQLGAQEGGELPPADYFPPWRPSATSSCACWPPIPAAIRTSTNRWWWRSRGEEIIHITSAYFVPDQQIVDALIAAARRGVDVRLVLPGVSDHGLVIRYAGQGFYDQLLAGGVKIFRAAGRGAARQDGGDRRRLVDHRLGQHRPPQLHPQLRAERGRHRPGLRRDMESAFNEDLRDSKEVTLDSGGTGRGRTGSRNGRRA